MFRSLIAFCLFALALLVAAPARATMEEEEYVMRVVERLASPAIHGRRMGTFGARLAANYLADELMLLGVQP
jgi:hypothetical protein